MLLVISFCSTAKMQVRAHALTSLRLTPTQEARLTQAETLKKVRSFSTAKLQNYIQLNRLSCTLYRSSMVSTLAL